MMAQCGDQRIGGCIEPCVEQESDVMLRRRLFEKRAGQRQRVAADAAMPALTLRALKVQQYLHRCTRWRSRV